MRHHEALKLIRASKEPKAMVVVDGAPYLMVTDGLTAQVTSYTEDELRLVYEAIGQYLNAREPDSDMWPEIISGDDVSTRNSLAQQLRTTTAHLKEINNHDPYA